MESHYEMKKKKTKDCKGCNKKISNRANICPLCKDCRLKICPLRNNEVT